MTTTNTGLQNIEIECSDYREAGEINKAIGKLYTPFSSQGKTIKFVDGNYQKIRVDLKSRNKLCESDTVFFDYGIARWVEHNRHRVSKEIDSGIAGIIKSAPTASDRFTDNYFFFNPSVHLSSLTDEGSDLYMRKTIDLSALCLESIPKDVFECPRLETLDLSYNSIREFDEGGMVQLKKLKKLFLQGNLLETAWFLTKASDLEYIDLSGNPLIRMDMEAPVEASGSEEDEDDDEDEDEPISLLEETKCLFYELVYAVETANINLRTLVFTPDPMDLSKRVCLMTGYGKSISDMAHDVLFSSQTLERRTVGRPKKTGILYGKNPDLGKNLK